MKRQSAFMLLPASDAAELIKRINNGSNGVYKTCTELGININEYYRRKNSLKIDDSCAKKFDELITENRRLKILLAESMLNNQKSA